MLYLCITALWWMSLNTPRLTLGFHYRLLTLGPTGGMMLLEETGTLEKIREWGQVYSSRQNLSQSCGKWLSAVHIQHQGFDLESPLWGLRWKQRAGCWLSSKGIKLRTSDQSYCPPNRVTSIYSTAHALSQRSWTCLFLMLGRNLGEEHPVQYKNKEGTALFWLDDIQRKHQTGSRESLYGLRGKNLSSTHGEAENKKACEGERKKTFSGIQQEEI